MSNPKDMIWILHLFEASWSERYIIFTCCHHHLTRASWNSSFLFAFDLLGGDYSDKFIIIPTTEESFFASFMVWCGFLSLSDFEMSWNPPFSLPIHFFYIIWLITCSAFSINVKFFSVLLNRVPMYSTISMDVVPCAWKSLLDLTSVFSCAVCRCVWATLSLLLT